MTASRLTFSMLLNIWASTPGFVFFISRMRFFTSMRLDFVSLFVQVVQVSVNLQAHCIKCRPLQSRHALMASSRT